MRSSFVILFVVLGVVSFNAPDKLEWKEFRSKAGRFEVLMPGTPKEQNAETESDFGKGVLYMSVLQAGETMYAANYCDYPAGVKELPLKQVFDSSRDGAVANLDGNLVSENDIKLDKHAGRELEIDVPRVKRLFRVRVFLVDQRLYQVVVFGTKQAATSKDADKFLNSFKLVEK